MEPEQIDGGFSSILLRERFLNEPQGSKGEEKDGLQPGSISDGSASTRQIAALGRGKEGRPTRKGANSFWDPEIYRQSKSTQPTRSPSSSPTRCVPGTRPPCTAASGDSTTVENPRQNEKKNKEKAQAGSHFAPTLNLGR